MSAYAREFGEEGVGEGHVTVLRTFPGTELLGLSYTPPFDFFVGRENAHRVLAADYVTTEDGTGLVHIAPAFGEEDKVVTDAAGIEVVVPVGTDGTFTVRAAVRGHARLRRQPRRSSATSRSAPSRSCSARSCATRPTTTRTRTAGAAATR